MNPCRTAVFVLLLPVLARASAPLLAAEPGTHFVRVPAPVVSRIADLGAEPIASLDYHTFVWLELTSADLARLASSDLPHEVRAEPFTLRLGEASFDPRVESPALPPGWDTAAGGGADLHLVQFNGPTRAEWVAHLESNGLEVVQYVHPYTYVVWGETGARSDVEAAGHVRWTGPFAPAYRVLPRWRALAAEGERVKVLLVRAADTDAAIAAVERLGGVLESRKVLNHTFEVAGFVLPGPALEAAAQVPGVYSIQPFPTDGGLRGEMSDQINVNHLDGDGLAYPGYEDWLAAVGLDGSGVIIANVDGGIQNSHPDLTNRFASCTGSTCGGGASSGHGTHTAGIMAADGSSGTVDSFGFLRGLGVSPGANLVEQLYSPTFTQPGGMLLLMTQSYNNGASLSGNSWGPSGTPHGYDDDTMQVDIGVRDAVPGTSGSQPLTYVLSFMNGNGGTSTQGTPDEAKNIFTIGSTKMQTGSGSQILAIDDLSANSAHGPALDGRKIPHMVAPGCSVDSTYTGSGYNLLCGTSMASPHVSGAVALFIEYYRSLPDYVSDPSPALIKAAFLPASHDLAGHLDADGGVLGHPFDSKQGWGRMDLEAVVDPPLSVRYFDNPAVFDNTGEEWSTTVAAEDPNQPMRIMLVWTDAPGHGLGGSTPAWNNDLDLMVESGSETYLGNQFGSQGWSVTGGVADFRNNTEGVFIGPTAPGSYTVRVVASNIDSDAIPGVGDGTDQDFALACYNCATDALFISLPEGAPPRVDPEAPTDILVRIEEGLEDYVPDSGTLHYRFDDGDFSTGALAPLGGSLYQATLPPATCSATPEFYFSAEGNGGATVYLPQAAPAETFSASVATLTIAIDDDFETAQGWTIQSIDTEDGVWQRGAPLGDGTRGDPVNDFDGSGKCYLTGNRPGNSDVDGGPVRLLSPMMDLTGLPDPVLRYARWFTNDDRDEDRLEVQVSDDDGATWVLIESVAHTEGWVAQEIHLNEYPIELNDRFRLRFSATDNPNNSVTEAAVDAVEISDISCLTPADGDFDGDGDVDLGDGANFTDCMAGPDATPDPTAPTTPQDCLDAFDFDTDLDVDLRDYPGFEEAFTG